jgi:hypothetical protein
MIHQCSDVQSLPVDVQQAMANLMFAASTCCELYFVQIEYLEND